MTREMHKTFPSALRLGFVDINAEIAEKLGVLVYYKGQGEVHMCLNRGMSSPPTYSLTVASEETGWQWFFIKNIPLIEVQEYSKLQNAQVMCL